MVSPSTSLSSAGIIRASRTHSSLCGGVAVGRRKRDALLRSVHNDAPGDGAPCAHLGVLDEQCKYFRDYHCVSLRCRASFLFISLLVKTQESILASFVCPSCVIWPSDVPPPTSSLLGRNPWKEATDRESFLNCVFPLRPDPQISMMRRFCLCFGLWRARI